MISLKYNIKILTETNQMQSRSSQWSECCQHRQQIAILQQKLMEIHNKLIDQLDVCRQQELTIIDLTRKLSHQQSGHHVFDTFNYQSFGHQSNFNQQENQMPNFNTSINHDSRQSHQTKTELLQADLQAMRNKVLTQITQKNKLKQEIKEMKINHKKDITFQLKKFEGIQSLHRKLQEEFDFLKQKYEKFKNSARSESELDRLTQRLSETQSRYLKERELVKSLQNQKRMLESRLQDFERQKYRNYQKIEKSNASDSSMIYQQKEIDNLKVQIQKLNKNIEVREVQFKQKGEQRRKKRGFQETKQLIKKLEQTETNMRRNRKVAL